MNVRPPDPPEAAAPTLSRRARRLREAPRRAGDRNEAALLEAARELLLSGEFQSTPIREIAERAGISRQGFYFYYQSKAELLAQLVTETLYGAQEGWRASLADGDERDPAGTIRRVLSSSVENWRRHREVLGAASEMAPRAPVILEHWKQVGEESADFLADMVAASTTIDELRDREAARRTLATLVWMLERNCYLHMVHGSDESDEALSQRLGDIYIRALGLERREQ